MATYGHQPSDEFTFHWAFNDIARAEELLRAHPEIVSMRTTHLDETPLHYLAVENQIEAVKLLIRYGADVNTRTDFGGTPLHSAATLGYTEMVRLLLEHGADHAAWSVISDTPLHEAADNGNLEIITMLLDAGADIAATSELGETPLSKAVEEGHFDAVRLLLARGADARSREWPILGRLGKRSTIRLAELLVAHGAPMNVCNDENWSELHLVVCDAPIRVVKWLLAHGADPNVVGTDGVTPSDQAKRYRRKDVVQLLKRYSRRS